MLTQESRKVEEGGRRGQRRKCDDGSWVGMMYYEKDSTLHCWLGRWRKEVMGQGMQAASRSKKGKEWFLPHSLQKGAQPYI